MSDAPIRAVSQSEQAMEKPIVQTGQLPSETLTSTAKSEEIEMKATPPKEATASVETERPPSSASQKHTDMQSGRARTSPSPSRSRTSSRPPEVSRSATIPKRPDMERVATNTHPSRLPPNLPNKPEPPRPYRHGDDRRDSRDSRHPDFSRPGRYGDAERERSFDHPMSDARGHGRVDRELLPPRGSSDEQFRGPAVRDGRPPLRETDWPDRSGRARPAPADNDRLSREGTAPMRSAAQPHPDRADLIREHPDRVALIESENQRRGEPSRPDREERRPHSSRASSPSRTDDTRPPRAHGRHDDFPTGPRGDRAGRGPDLMEPREPWSGPDMSHGRLNQESRFPRQQEPPSDIPSGPRGRNGPGRGRNVSTPQPSTPGAGNERQPPTGPASRTNTRSGLHDQTPSATDPSPIATDRPDTSGIHPDRLRNLHIPAEPPFASGRSQAPITAPSGPRGSPVTRGPPSGPGFGPERGRGDKRFAGINNMLQQSGGPSDRGGLGASIRGRGRQASSMNTASPHGSRPASPPGGSEEVPGSSSAPVRPELFPGTASSQPDDDSRPVGRPRGGRRSEVADDGPSEMRRSGRFGNTPDRDREREKDRDRRGEEDILRGNGRRDDRRDRYRDRDGERSGRRSDNESREEPSQEVRESSGRRGGPPSRDENRKRDRRDRDDVSTDHSGTGAGNESQGRLRPPSSLGSPLPPPPPPPPAGPGEERRWGGRGENRDNRERERNPRDRGGRDRDRDYREGGNTLPRKRGRPGDEGHGDGSSGGRGGMRVGSESKRPRRGA
jgi:THO complex subunit 2